MRNDERLRTIYEVMAPYIVRSERNWRDYLAFASRFHKQSFDNILLVYAQDEDVTILASKKQWASVGRNLISRPKGIAVCVYSNARLTLDYTSLEYPLITKDFSIPLMQYLCAWNSKTGFCW